MNSEQPDPLEDELVHVLAAYEHALANGIPLADLAQKVPPPEFKDRFEEALACLQSLQELWPSTAQSSQPGSRYRMLRPHAAGGIGQVWLAHDDDLDRDVALKELQPTGRADPAFQRRFLREARITGRLQHPGIVPVYELVSATDAHPPFYTMRFVQGRTLTEAVQEYHARRAQGASKTLDLYGLLAVFVSVCNTVAYAHSRSIIHRDLKSQNIMLGEFGEVILLDWGFAQERGQAEETSDSLSDPASASADLTLAGQILGTPAYMSPEQASGRRDLIDERTDVFGLGAVLYEILTGRPPFAGTDPNELIRLARETVPRPPQEVRADLAPALAAICMRALAHKREDRYASATELACDVQHWLADEPTVAYQESRTERLRRSCRRHKPLVGGAAALVVTVFTVGMIAWGLHEKEQARTSEIAQQVLERHLYCERLNLAERELVAHNLARVTHLLEECPPARRGWEWRCLQRLSRTDQTVFHDDTPLAGAVLCAHETCLASAGQDGFVKLWDLRSRAVRHTFMGHAAPVSCIAVSPSGDQIATGSRDGIVKVWDSATGRELKCLPANGSVNRVAFTRDGRRVVGLTRENIYWWDWTTGQQAGDLKDSFYCLAFSPDGRHMATAGGEKQVKLWDLETGTVVRRFNGEDNAPRCLAFSPDGRRLAVGAGDPIQGRPGSIGVWDVDNSRLLWTLQGHTYTVFALAFSPDGQRLISGSADNTLKIWDTADGQLILTLRGHRDAVRSLVFSADGQRLVSASLDRTMRIWDAASWTEEQTDGSVRVLHGENEQIVGLGFSGDGKRVRAVDYDSVLKTWDPATGTALERLALAQFGRFHSLATSRDGKLLALGCGSGSVLLLNGETGEPIGECPGLSAGPVLGLAFSNDAKRVAAGQWLQTIRIYDVKERRPIRVLRGHSDAVIGVAYSSDDRWIASASVDQTARIWDAHTGEQLHVLASHKSRVICVAFDPTGRVLATAANDGHIKLWDVATGKELHDWCGHPAAVSRLAFDPTGRWLASASDDWTVKLWDPHTGDLIKTFRGHTGAVRIVLFAPGGRQLASAGQDHTVRLWRLSP